MKGKNVGKLVVIMMLASVYPLGMNTAWAQELDPTPPKLGEESKEDYQVDLVQAEAKKSNLEEEIKGLEKEIDSKEKIIESEKLNEEIDTKLEDLQAKKENTQEEVNQAKDAYEKAKLENTDQKKIVDEKINALFPTEEEYEKQKVKTQEAKDEVVKKIKENNKKLSQLSKKREEYQTLKLELDKRESNLTNLNEDESIAEKNVIENLKSKLASVNDEIDSLKIYEQPEYKNPSTYEPTKLEKLEARLKVKESYEAGNINSENINSLVSEQESIIESTKNSFSIAHKKFKNYIDRREEIYKTSKSNLALRNALVHHSLWLKQNRGNEDDLYFKYNKATLEEDIIKSEEEVDRLDKDINSKMKEANRLLEEEEKYTIDNNLKGYNSTVEEEKLEVYKLMRDILSNTSPNNNPNLLAKQKDFKLKRDELKKIEEAIAEAEKIKSQLQGLTEEKKQALQEEINQAKILKQAKELELAKVYREIYDLKKKIGSFIDDESKPSDLGAFTEEYMSLDANDNLKEEAAKQRLRQAIPRLEMAYRKALTVVEKAEIYVKNETMLKDKREKLQSLINKHWSLMNKLAVLIVRLDAKSR